MHKIYVGLNKMLSNLYYSYKRQLDLFLFDIIYGFVFNNTLTKYAEKQLTAKADIAEQKGDWHHACDIWAILQRSQPTKKVGYFRGAQAYYTCGNLNSALLLIKSYLGRFSPCEEDLELTVKLLSRLNEQSYERFVQKARIKSNTTRGGSIRRPGTTVHLIIYSNGEPYQSTAKKLSESFIFLNSRKTVVHSLQLQDIIHRPWFKEIKDCPQLPKKHGYRDGYYNGWKAHLVNEVFQQASSDDIIYYVDASRFFEVGFYEPVDALMNAVAQSDNMIFGGSYNRNCLHGKKGVGDNLDLYADIGLHWPAEDLLELPAILNSSFAFKKNINSQLFVEEWTELSVYKYLSMHQTVDQAIFSALVYKHDVCSFNMQCSPLSRMINDRPHYWGKDHNLVHRALKSGITIDKAFSNARSHVCFPCSSAMKW